MDNNINGFDYENIDKYIELIRSQNSRWNMIPSPYYTKYNVKRGLRNADGTGVLAGLTSIGEVHGYVIDEGTKSPIEGKLRYRGIDVEDIVANCSRTICRYGYNRIRSADSYPGSFYTKSDSGSGIFNSSSC